MIFSCGKKSADQEPNNTILEASDVVLGEPFALKILLLAMSMSIGLS